MPGKLVQTIDALVSFQKDTYKEKRKPGDHLGPTGDTIKALNKALNAKDIADRNNNDDKKEEKKEPVVEIKTTQAPIAEEDKTTMFLVLSDSVGANSTNYAGDVRNTQIALRILGYTIPDSENPDKSFGEKDIVSTEDNPLTKTIEAIKAFQNDFFGPTSDESLRGLIKPGGPTHKKINSFLVYLTDTVGKDEVGAVNHAGDVSRVQKALIALGYAIPESEFPSAQQVENDEIISSKNGRLDKTIEAINLFQVENFENKKKGDDYMGPAGATFKRMSYLLAQKTLAERKKTSTVKKDDTEDDDVNESVPVSDDKTQDTDTDTDNSDETEVTNTDVEQQTTNTGFTIVPSESENARVDEKLKKLLVLKGDVGNEFKKKKAENYASDVKAVQDVLIKAGYTIPESERVTSTQLQGDKKLAADTLPETFKAIGQFQLDHKITVTNYVSKDGSTVTALNRAMTTPQTPTQTQLDKIKANRKKDFVVTETVFAQPLIDHPITSVIGNSSGATANEKADLERMQDVLTSEVKIFKAKYAVSKIDKEKPAQLITSKKLDKTATHVSYKLIPSTIALIKDMQSYLNVKYLFDNRNEILVEMGMDKTLPYQSGVIQKNDATYVSILNLKKFKYDFTVEGGQKKSLTMRNFYRYGSSDSYDPRYAFASTGAESEHPWVNSDKNLDVTKFNASLYTSSGLEPKQMRAMMWASRNEGGFDAFNTYDTRVMSVGFAQFAGNYSFEKYLALIKYRNPGLFAEYFQKYGIDVEFNVKDDNIDKDIKLYVFDPDTKDATKQVITDSVMKDQYKAKKYIRSQPALIAAFVRASYDPRIRVIQMELVYREYGKPAEDVVVSISVPYIQLMKDDKKTVLATYIGNSAVKFKDGKHADNKTYNYSAMSKAGRIVSQTKTYKVTIGDVLQSEVGLAGLYDACIHRGVGKIKSRFPKAFQKTADENECDTADKLKSVSDVIILGNVSGLGGDGPERMKALLEKATGDKAKKQTYAHHNLSDK